MSVANILNIPASPSDMRTWGTLHMIWHRNVIRSIFLNKNIALTEYVLDPAELRRESTWPQNHQTMHAEMDAVLGLSGYDLSDVDWTNQEEVLGWFELHGDITQQEADASGVFA